MITVNRRFPRNIKEGERSLFTPHLQIGIPSPSLKKYQNVRASGMGILVKSANLLPESFPDLLEGEEWKVEWKYYNKP